jgi:hypothetical protein
MRLRLTSQPIRHMCEPPYGVGQQPSHRFPNDSGLFPFGNQAVAASDGSDRLNG